MSEQRMTPEQAEAEAQRAIERAKKFKRISEIEQGPEILRVSTGIGGLDTCLAESDDSPPGMPMGCSILLSGMPGGGKSTMATFMAGANVAGESLYMHGEERASSVKGRWDRLGIKGADPYLVPLKKGEDAMDVIRDVQPLLAVLDSVQCLSLDGKRGHTHQAEAAEMIVGLVTGGGGSVILVNHVSKSGDAHAGSQSLAHFVDVHLHVTMNARRGERMLEVRKNRFGRAGFQVPLHIGLSSLTVGTPAPLALGAAMGQANTALDRARNQAMLLLMEGRTLSGYDYDLAAENVNPGMWRAGLEGAAKQLVRDGFSVEELLVRGRRSYRMTAPPNAPVVTPGTLPPPTE